ncbi:MFS transporter [Bacillus carboniphilus]|uniref:MFS transporter n=1 Tax=Bacillus carboniphilus TaxID=86663 RepID=A0ABY9JY26_9BACI|nr:MFS transporter [Bacillus carboniphilus]WLR42526.1 MFS transporter [Bacillus carboniphilus]
MPLGRFIILVIIVAISGFSQGMLLPVIAIIFEEQGVSSTINGLHATGIYIGIFIASFFMEEPLRKLGYKRIIVIGGLLVIVSLVGFVFIQSILFWFILRLLIGVGDHMLHFSTQTWITSDTEEAKRGRTISIYGLSFGLGFAAGPLLATFTNEHPHMPFMICAFLSLVAWSLVFLLKNEFPEQSTEYASISNTVGRFIQVIKIAWIALLPTLAYGFLEASLNGNYPVYALRTGLTSSDIALILTSFSIGSIIFQIPLGMISDKVGRKKIISTITFLGSTLFFIASFLQSPLALIVCLALAGMAIGSIFSLGISFMADLVPRSLLPAGNLLSGISFSIGSIVGPFLGGMYIQFVPGGNFFHVISSILFLLFVTTMIHKQEKIQLHS